jgi:photosystem II stability/assembly factor-like uncharacterized protein
MDWQFPTVFGDADGTTDFGIARSQCQAVWIGATNTFVQYGGPYEDIETTTGYLGIGWPGFFPQPSFTIPEINFLYVSIDSLGKGFATVSGGGFVKTVDNGLSWNIAQNIAENDFHGYSTDIYTIDSYNAFAVGWSGNLIRTINGGVDWNSTNIDTNLEKLHSIVHPANKVYVVCGDYGTILRSTDDATTWKPSTVSTTAFLEAVAFSSASTGIAVGAGGTILRTTDQGVTWSDVPNPLTNSQISYHRLTGFPSGTYYATTDSSGLFTSTDQGQNWHAMPNAPQTIGMGFYNERIGVIAEKGWTSRADDRANDTARIAFTTDGFASKPTEFNIPIINNNRMAFHFLDSNSFLCFASDGFVVRVDMSPSGVQVTDLSTQTSPIQAFPNPSASHSTTIEYDLDRSGETKIELLNELGERVQTLFAGNEEIGHHTQQVKIGQGRHGTYFVRVLSGTQGKTLSIIVE